MTSVVNPGSPGPAALGALEFDRIREIVYRACGINLTPDKRTRVESRVLRRARLLGLASAGDYCDLLAAAPEDDQELVALIDAITVNKTDFFREPVHFDYLTGEVLPQLAAQGVGIMRTLQVWSAACSTGEEPYTLAMVIREFFRNAGRAPRIAVTATDISTAVLEKAVKAIYPADVAAAVPAAFEKRYLLRSRDPARREVRVAPEVRGDVRFARVDLVHDSLAGLERMDVIFCRNVLIYFDRPTQENVVRRLARQLRPGGYLFTGHAEVLSGFDMPVARVAPTICRRVE
jgi:chemotaxis protein methyltransferase CheR